jgi:hypothetical protein
MYSQRAASFHYALDRCQLQVGDCVFHYFRSGSWKIVEIDDCDFVVSLCMYYGGIMHVLF